MTTTEQQKAPVAKLGGTRDEGQESTPTKEIKMNSTIVSAGVSTRIQLEPNVILDVDLIGESHVEVTVTTVDRSTIGIGLSIEETRRFAEALLDASAPAFGYAPVEELEEHARIARKAAAPLTPAKFAKQLREAN